VQKALRQTLNTGFGVGGNPEVQSFVILKQAVSGRQIFSLKNKLQRNPAARVIGYAEADRVAGALLR
jgi:hypothetical protein